MEEIRADRRGTPIPTEEWSRLLGGLNSKALKRLIIREDRVEGGSSHFTPTLLEFSHLHSISIVIPRKIIIFYIVCINFLR